MQVPIRSGFATRVLLWAEVLSTCAFSRTGMPVLPQPVWGALLGTTRAACSVCPTQMCGITHLGSAPAVANRPLQELCGCPAA